MISPTGTTVTAAPRPCPSCGTPLPAEAHFCLNCGSATPTEPGVPQRTMPTGAFEVSKVRTALADRYKILRILGEGGMATVYLAEDLKHKREVAVKVMRPELSETLGAERFLREVEIAAKLSHPNILPVYDSGTAQGVLYYVMPVVEGESLPARIKREKQLPVEEALRLAREVAEAMAYAHARGFVHRDIKPANILISAGHALVADFGIARAMEGDGQSITQTGLAIGTPQYMSPEQASGATDLDGRSDIYALGCVLYEMIAGEPPFTGPTVQAVIMRSMTEAPRPLEQTRTSLPPAVGAVVTRALAKSPADRYANAGAMVTALVAAERDTQSGFTTAPPAARGGFKPWQIGVAAAAVLAIGALGVKAFGGGNDTAATAMVAKRIAVLPFQHIGADEDAYLADGIVDELRGKLSRLGNVTVIASTSADQYRGTTKTGPEIARELRVDQVLTGKVQWAGGAAGGRRVRVSAEMVDGKTGQITWTETFDADLTDVFAMQSQLATRVAGALGTAISRTDALASGPPPTENAAAYDLYLRAQAAPRTMNGARTAVDFLEQAVVLDSTFADAWVLLSTRLSRLYDAGTRDPVTGRRAKEALDRALRLAPNLSSAHRAASLYYAAVEPDVERSDRAMNRALELDPDNAELLAFSADEDFRAERYDVVFKKLSRARELDPLSESVLTTLIRTLVNLNRLEEARRVGEELMALQPQSWGAIQWLTGVHEVSGDLDRARAVFQEAVKDKPITQVLVQFSGFNEQAFLFNEEQREMLFRLTPAAFDNDRAWWGQSLSIAARQQGDMVRARAYADSSLATSKQQSDANPDDPQLRALYAVMLAYAGRTAEAIVEADRAVSSAREGDNSNGPYARVQRIRVLMAAGETDKAIDGVEDLLQRQYYVTRGYLKVDPTYAPLKGNPRFERLLVGGLDVPRN
ncbi:MAG: protein kinase [Gemmatimonadales bacterium]|nr:protein kinase [Gemmatimonadales bacterium]